MALEFLNYLNVTTDKTPPNETWLLLFYKDRVLQKIYDWDTKRLRNVQNRGKSYKATFGRKKRPEELVEAEQIA